MVSPPAFMTAGGRLLGPGTLSRLSEAIPAWMSHLCSGEYGWFELMGWHGLLGCFVSAQELIPGDWQACFDGTELFHPHHLLFIVTLGMGSIELAQHWERSWARGVPPFLRPNLWSILYTSR